MAVEKGESLSDPDNTRTRTHRTRKVVKYLLSFALFWYILHKWLFPLTHRFGFKHPYTCTHDLSWAIEAFAPKEPGVPTSKLAENFFL
jgi:hypothetical protein